MSKLNVLVVQQDQSAIERIKRLLPPEDHCVETARSLELAFEIVLKRDIHIVVTSLKSLSLELKHFLKIPPLIILIDEYVESMPHGADLFIQALNFKPENLPGIMRNLVESRRQRLAS